MSDFFRLKIPEREWKAVHEQAEFIGICNKPLAVIHSIVYYPDTLKSSSKHQYIKLEKKRFINCSFRNTNFKNIIFKNCVFDSCLLMSTQFYNCKFTACQFIHVNTKDIKFIGTYVDPKSFLTAIPENSFINRIHQYINKNKEKKNENFANIGVQLYQALLDDCNERSQLFFSLEAEYQFRRWDRILHEYYYFDKVNGYGLCSLVLKTLWSFVGYGIKIEKYIGTLLLIFCTFILINNFLWDMYFVGCPPVKNGFEFSLQYTFYSCFSIGATPYAATSLIGIFFAIAQGVIGWLLVGIGISIITKRVVG